MYRRLSALTENGRAGHRKTFDSIHNDATEQGMDTKHNNMWKDEKETRLALKVQKVGNGVDKI
jgi:hypothetical protein